MLFIKIENHPILVETLIGYFKMELSLGIVLFKVYSHQ
jgi:hypothetical protein